MINVNILFIIYIKNEIEIKRKRNMNLLRDGVEECLPVGTETLHLMQNFHLFSPFLFTRDIVRTISTILSSFPSFSYTKYFIVISYYLCFFFG